MGSCSWCGRQFPKTRATRKYCTPKCKTNACLGRKPTRIRAADVAALYALLEAEFVSADELRDRLRAILVPESEPLPLVNGRAIIPGMD